MKMQSSLSGNLTTMSNKAVSMINEANLWWEKFLVQHSRNITVVLTIAESDVVTADLSATDSTSYSEASTSNTKSKIAVLDFLRHLKARSVARIPLKRI